MKAPMLSLGWAPYVLLTPFVLLFLVFGLFPLGFSFVLMFHTWDPIEGLGAMHYVGLDNLDFALHDPLMWVSLSNTLWLALASGLPQHLVAIPLAFLINERLGRWRNTAMGIYFLPYITSTVAIAMMFATLFSTDYGVVNSALQALSHWPLLGQWLGSGRIDWLGQPETIKPVVALVVFWRYVGFNTILYVAAMQGIPRDLYEAARLDGASERRIFWHITLPQLKPMIYFGSMLTLIGGLQLFEEPFILTGGKGGIEYAGMTTALYMYRNAFEFSDFGLASAISWLLFACILVLTLLAHRLFKKRGGA
jgi:multiple sugar transport system permease protein